MGKFDINRKISENLHVQFGYYVGSHISAVPTDYLMWAALHMDNEDKDERAMVLAAQNELDYRIAKIKSEKKDVETDPAE